jgi:hypothetical protein
MKCVFSSAGAILCVPRLNGGAWAYSGRFACGFAKIKSIKAGGIKNRPSAKKRGTPKSLPLENHTKSQCNP